MHVAASAALDRDERRAIFWRLIHHAAAKAAELLLVRCDVCSLLASVWHRFSARTGPCRRWILRPGILFGGVRRGAWLHRAWLHRAWLLTTSSARSRCVLCAAERQHSKQREELHLNALPRSRWWRSHALGRLAEARRLSKLALRGGRHYSSGSVVTLKSKLRLPLLTLT